jgi:hypothetical protein
VKPQYKIPGYFRAMRPAPSPPKAGYTTIGKSNLSFMYAKNLENHTTNRPNTTLTAPQSIPKMRYRGSSAKQKWETMITVRTTCVQRWQCKRREKNSCNILNK